MQRDPHALTNAEYDLVIIGGGIFGICIAWDAILRGLSVALVEKGDFAHATSGNCFKLVHGGMRYLQHADFLRIRESSRERNVLLRIAPHLVRRIPFVVPTYGHGLKGKEILCAGLVAYSFITYDRNRKILDPDKRIPAGHLISRQKTLELFPGLSDKGLTGAVIFYDGQMHSPARLALSYLKSAARAGVSAVNYVEATGFLTNGNRIYGIRARDSLSKAELEIRAKVVVNAAGPWADRLLQGRLGLRVQPKPAFSRDAFFVIRHRINDDYALALPSRSKDRDAFFNRGNRHLFLVPWANHTLVGVWHGLYKGEPDRVNVTEQDLAGFVDEVNAAYPLGLSLRDVSTWNTGLILFGDNNAEPTTLSYGKRSRLIDHAGQDGVQGLVSVIGVRYTTSRKVAKTVVDLVFRKLQRPPPRSATETTPIYGGQVSRFSDLLRQVIQRHPYGLGAEVVSSLLLNHGSEYGQVLKYVDGNAALAEPLGGSTVIKAEVIHAVREEMAQKLTDVVFRRTDLATSEYPGDLALQACGAVMAAELGWDRARLNRELSEVKASFPRAACQQGESLRG